MKTIYRLLTLLTVLALAWSCGEDDNMDGTGNWEIAAPTLSAPADNASIVLNEATPAAKTRFEWSAAVASNKFVVSYTVVLVPAESENFDTPLLSITPGNAGKNLFAETTAQQIDYALWTACYPAGSVAKLKWAVIAKAIEKTVVTSQTVSFTRFETEYFPSTLFITGAATEAGTDVTKATAMRAQKNADGDLTYSFDVYTTLTKGATYQFRDQANLQSRIYGGKDGALQPCGEAITAPETGQYRVTVDLINNTYTLLKIDKWSVVGDVIEGSWGGDVPLAYIGNSVWEAKLELLKPSETASFVFRANGDWGYLLKRIEGTDNKVFMESEAPAAGITVENVPSKDAATYTVTLNLAADKYTYALVIDPSTQPAQPIIGDTKSPDADAVSGNFSISGDTAPATLFLVADGASVAEFTKDGTTFSTVTYIPLQQSKTYQLNSKADGTGTVYGDEEIAAARDQAYLLTVDFSTKKLGWKYYNMKLFHWDNNGGWDARKEYVMTYVHPLKFEGTFDLTAGYDSKFNSPWEVEFGTSATSLTGTMNHVPGGPNFKGIVETGTYKASITVANDYKSCTYAFVKQ